MLRSYFLHLCVSLSPCATEPLLQASPYPLILSLENHCSVEQQTVMARHLRSILGDKLLTKPLDDISPLILPSPEVSGQLCGLISLPLSKCIDIDYVCLLCNCNSFYFLCQSLL